MTEAERLDLLLGVIVLEEMRRLCELASGTDTWRHYYFLYMKENNLCLEK